MYMYVSAAVITLSRFDIRLLNQVTGYWEAEIGMQGVHSLSLCHIFLHTLYIVANSNLSHHSRTEPGASGAAHVTNSLNSFISKPLGQKPVSQKLTSSQPFSLPTQYSALGATALWAITLRQKRTKHGTGLFALAYYKYGILHFICCTLQRTAHITIGTCIVGRSLDGYKLRHWMLPMIAAYFVFNQHSLSQLQQKQLN